MAQIDLGQGRDILLAVTPDVFNRKIMGYTHEGYAMMRNESSMTGAWYAVWFESALRWSVSVLIVFGYFRGKELWEKNKGMINLLSFALLFLGIANFAVLVPSGGRFITVSNMFALAFIFLLFHRYENKREIKTVLLILSPLLILYLVVTTRIGFETIGILTILGNPILAVLFQSEISLLELLR